MWASAPRSNPRTAPGQRRRGPPAPIRPSDVHRQSAGARSQRRSDPFTPADIGDHELARLSPSSRAFTSAAMAATGVATNATAARWSTPISSTAPSSRACRALASSRSRPVTRQPCARRPRAIDVPTSPRPVTCARARGGGRGHARDLSRGGHREARVRPRDRRGAALVSCARCRSASGPGYSVASRPLCRARWHR